MADYADGYKDGMDDLIKALLRVAVWDPTDQIKYLGFGDINIDSCYEGLQYSAVLQSVRHSRGGHPV